METTMSAVPEAKLLAAQLARIKTLIESLEAACSETEEQRETFIKLKQEMASVRASLKTLDTNI